MMSETSPLEALECQILFVEAKREARDEVLQEVPRWRFRRRRDIRTQLRGLRRSERTLREAQVSSSAVGRGHDG